MAGKSSMKIYHLGLLKGWLLAVIEEFDTVVFGVAVTYNQQTTHSEGLRKCLYKQCCIF